MADFRLLFKKLQSQISAIGHGMVLVDPVGTAIRKSLQGNRTARVEWGIVIRSGLASYDCAVKIGMFEVPCNILSVQSSQGFGVTEGNIPVEGSYVWVLLLNNSYGSGWIIGVVPRANHLTPNSKHTRNVHMHYPNEDVSPWKDNAAYNVPYDDKKYSGRRWSNANRPSDVHPGEHVVENENHVGVLNSMYAVEVTGGNSFVRVDRLDDSIRERSTNFTHWSSQRACSEFNDGGHISAEGRYYSYQGELLGNPSGGHTSEKYKRPSDTEGKEPRPRVRFWKSFLGNLISYFVVRPRKNNDDYDTTLASMHVSQAGNVMVRAGGGISLERYDRIPTPKRLKYAWDPEGDRGKDCKHEAFQPFKVNNPHDRALALASKQAWEQKTMYQRWDELKKDFEVQNEADVKLPQNGDEDPKESEEIRYNDYHDRHAGVFVGDDGSIIIRDTWGSEIVMLGGNIYVNTPGNVLTTANKDIVSIARHTIAMRGTDAAELSSEEKDVRIHAKKIVTVAGGTDGSDGGVLIESLAKSPIVSAAAKAGDAAIIGGVVVRSEEAGVSISGIRTYVTGKEQVFLTGGPDGGTRTGDIFIDGKNVVTTADKMGAMVSHESIVFVNSKNVISAAPKTGLLVGKQSATVVNGDEVPVMWAPIDANFDRLFKSAQSIFKTLQDSSIIEPYSWDNLVANAVYSFRSSAQALTDKGIEPWWQNGSFTMYEPWWQVMKEYKDPNIESASPYHPDAQEVHGTKCWPYKDSIDSGVFRKCPKPANLDTWWSKPRDELKDEEELESGSMGDFKV